MDKKDLSTLVKDNVSKIKVALGLEEEQEEVKLEDVRTVDGTILRIEPAVEDGASVQVIGEDGELIEAPDGEHELESGDVITTEGGIIISVVLVDGEPVVEEEMSAEGEEAPVVEENPNAINVEELTNNVMNKLNEAITNKINNLKFASVEELEALKEENASLKQSLIDTLDLVEKFAETEVEEPKKKVVSPFKKEKKEFDFASIGKALKNTKNTKK